MTPCYQHDRWRMDCADCRDMDAPPAEIARRLAQADKRGLCKPPGSGEFSRSCLDRLVRYGLMEWHNFMPTDLGWAVRRQLGCVE